jgi:hypothetical protein
MIEVFTNWQDIAAISIVAVACAYLLWRGWLVLKRRRAGCGACSTCPSSESSEKQFVTLDSRSGRQNGKA